MAIESYTVKSIEQFTKLTCGIRHKWSCVDGKHFNPWFRGQTNAGWGLSPSIYRHDLAKQEHDIRAEFQRRASLLMSERAPSDEWSWYFIMQHYAAPTRLLDWSDGALIALFFALNPPRVGDPAVTSDAAVWMLDPWWLNRQVARINSVLLTDWREAAGYLPALYGGRMRKRLPVAISPPHIARRLSVQLSRFTIHGTLEEGLLKVGERSGSRLVQIIIRKSAIERMRSDLWTCGITDTTVFPDLEGLSREIIRYWTDTWTWEGGSGR